MTKKADFSIVIPTAFRVRRREIERRALALARDERFAGQEVIVSHGEWNDDSGFCQKLESAGARVAVSRLNSASVPLGMLRNRGAELATAKHLLFWDVDLVQSPELLSQLQRRLEHPNSRFLIVPCIYASLEGTRRLVSGGVFDCSRALGAFYEHRRDLVLHLALNTSTVAIERSYFFSQGGFDERYLDHGLEDLDFLLRLALKDESLPIPVDLLSDERHQSAAFSTGFRSVLNLLSLPLLLDGMVTLHQWHRRPLWASYYQRRSENYALFGENVRTLLHGRPLGSFGQEWQGVARSDGTLDSVLAVHRLLSRSANPPKDPSALFDEVPQFYFHPDRIRRRLLRGLLGVLGRQKPKDP